MARIPLSEAEDWELVNQDQDIRGRWLLDADRNQVGTIAEMIVDTDNECIEAIVLDNGDEYSVRDFELHSDGVMLLPDAAPSALAASTADDSPPSVHVGNGEVATLSDSRPEPPVEPAERAVVERSETVVAEGRKLELPLGNERLVIEYRPLKRRLSDEPIGAGHGFTIALGGGRVSIEAAAHGRGVVTVQRQPSSESQDAPDAPEAEELLVKVEELARAGSPEVVHAGPATTGTGLAG